jgi:hypothetical protein
MESEELSKNKNTSDNNLNRVIFSLYLIKSTKCLYLKFDF